MNEENLDERKRFAFALGRLKGELVQQCRFVILAVRQVQTEPREELRWFSIQAALAAGAMVSKVLWDESKKPNAEHPDRIGPVLVEERKELRRVLGITKASPLRDRKMRNHFEHFDRDLGRWIETTGGGNMSIRSQPHPVLGSIEAENFGYFDPGTLEVTFLGDSINLKAMKVEAERILCRIEQVGWSAN